MLPGNHRRVRHSPSLFIRYSCNHQVATLVKRKSWKAMINAGQDPGKAISLILGLIVRLVVGCNSLTTTLMHIFHIIRSCTITSNIFYVRYLSNYISMHACCGLRIHVPPDNVALATTYNLSIFENDIGHY